MKTLWIEFAAVAAGFFIAAGGRTCLAQAPSATPERAIVIESQGWPRPYPSHQIRDEGRSPSLAARALWYLPNRLADLMDLMALNVGFGMGVHVNAHATRLAQVGFGGAAQPKLGFDGRCVGVFNEARSELSLLPFSVEHYRRTNAFGCFPEIDTGVARDRLYLDGRDYWGLGAALTAGVFAVEVEVKPSEMPDFILGWTGLDARHDDWPRAIRRPSYSRFHTARRQGIQKMAVVTSRVTSSRRLRAEAGRGVTVYAARASASSFWGALGNLTGRGSDLRAEREFYRYYDAGQFDAGLLVASKMARTLGQRTAIPIIPPEAFVPYENRKSERTLGGEQVLRLPDYRGLCEALGADALCDVRLLEWSLYRDQALKSLRVRLHVACKVIQQPHNELLAEVSAIAYDQGKQSGADLGEYARDQGHLLRFETEQASERVAAALADRLIEF